MPTHRIGHVRSVQNRLGAALKSNVLGNQDENSVVDTPLDLEARKESAPPAGIVGSLQNDPHRTVEDKLHVTCVSHQSAPSVVSNNASVDCSLADSRVCSATPQSSAAFL